MSRKVNLMKYKYTALTASIFYIIYGYAGIANATVQDDVIAPNYIQTPELTVNNINSSGLIAANLINANDLTANAINVNGGVSSTSQNTVTQTVQNVYFTDDYGNYAGSAI